MLTTGTAKSMLMRDRLDWNRPHLNWLSKAFYSVKFRRRHDPK